MSGGAPAAKKLPAAPTTSQRKEVITRTRNSSKTGEKKGETGVFEKPIYYQKKKSSPYKEDVRL